MAGEKDLKHWFSRSTVAELGDLVFSESERAERQRFVRAATRGLDRLELKGRVAHIAEALRGVLGAETVAALERFVRVLGPSESDTNDVTERHVTWPLCTYVETYGLDAPAASLDAIHTLTQHFSCEFAIRPFLIHHPELATARLRQWVSDRSPHVRRLVSEGTRPRLPWAQRLPAYVRDPRPNLALLDALATDSSEYVRRSVANHLGDIAKDHPELAVKRAKKWLRRHPGAHTEWVVRHGLRGPLKQGDAGALSLFGYEPAEIRAARLRLSDKSVRFGSELGLSFELISLTTQDVMIDYAILHRKANGALTPKVFKWQTKRLESGERLRLDKRHPFRPITTRRYHSGAHGVEVFVNGKRVADARFQLVGVPKR
jgi:3-methyladenine DNA glycosylase AlkC